MAKFTELEITTIEGGVEKYDASKELGNLLYLRGRDVEICELGKRIYYGEDVALTDAQKAEIRVMTASYPYVYRQAIEKELKYGQDKNR